MRRFADSFFACLFAFGDQFLHLGVKGNVFTAQIFLVDFCLKFLSFSGTLPVTGTLMALGLQFPDLRTILCKKFIKFWGTDLFRTGFGSFQGIPHRQLAPAAGSIHRLKIEIDIAQLGQLQMRLLQKLIVRIFFQFCDDYCRCTVNIVFLQQLIGGIESFAALEYRHDVFQTVSITGDDLQSFRPASRSSGIPLFGTGKEVGSKLKIFKIGFAVGFFAPCRHCQKCRYYAK